MAHPTDSSTLLPCLVCHNHHSTGPSSVKRYEMRYEEEDMPRTSQNRKTKFREFFPEGG